MLPNLTKGVKYIIPLIIIHKRIFIDVSIDLPHFVFVAEYL